MPFIIDKPFCRYIAEATRYIDLRSIRYMRLRRIRYVCFANEGSRKSACRKATYRTSEASISNAKCISKIRSADLSRREVSCQRHDDFAMPWDNGVNKKAAIYAIVTPLDVKNMPLTKIVIDYYLFMVN